MGKELKQQSFYNHASMEGGFFSSKYDVLRKLVSPNLKVLDLGCYDGRVATFLVREFNCTVDGADISSIQIKKAKDLTRKYVFDLNDQKWPINKKYDLIIFTDVIEHIFDTDQFMKNVHKLTKPKGHIIYATPNIASLGRRLLLLSGKNPFIEVSNHPEVNLFNAPVVGHIRYFTLPTMKSLAEYHGFSVTDVVPTPTTGLLFKIIETLFPSLCWHIFIKAKRN